MPLFVLCIDIHPTGSVVLEDSIPVLLHIHELDKGISLDDDRKGFQTLSLPIRRPQDHLMQEVCFSVRLVALENVPSVGEMSLNPEGAATERPLPQHIPHISFLRNGIERSFLRSSHRRCRLRAQESCKNSGQATLESENPAECASNYPAIAGSRCDLNGSTSLSAGMGSTRRSDRFQYEGAIESRKGNKKLTSSMREVCKPLSGHNQISRNCRRSKQGVSSARSSIYRSPSVQLQAQKRRFYKPPPNRCRPLARANIGKKESNVQRRTKSTSHTYACAQHQSQREKKDRNYGISSSSEKLSCLPSTDCTASGKNSPDLGMKKASVPVLRHPDAREVPSHFNACAVAMWELINLISVRSLLSQTVHIIGAQMACAAGRAIQEFSERLALDKTQQTAQMTAPTIQCADHLLDQTDDAGKNQGTQTEIVTLCNSAVQYETSAQTVSSESIPEQEEDKASFGELMLELQRDKEDTTEQSHQSHVDDEQPYGQENKIHETKFTGEPTQT